MSKIPYKFDSGSHTPLSRQLVATLKLAIIHGDYKPGEVLPTMEELSKESRCSLKVARRALEILAADGWTHPVCGVGSVVLERNDGAIANGRLLVYVRQTGYSYYCSGFLSVLESRLLAHGYKTYALNASARSESPALRRFENLLKEKWSLVIVFSGGAKSRRLAEESGQPFMLIGDGAPLPVCKASTCMGRVDFRIGKALPDFVAECEKRRIQSVIQFKYDRGSFDATKMLAASGIESQTIRFRRESSPEAVSLSAMKEMSRIVRRGKFPDLFLFTDDVLAQGALITLAMAGVKIPKDVAVATHANKGLGPIWPKALSRLEVDPAANGRKAADAIVRFFSTGSMFADLDLGSVWRKGETM